jgi:hypothetical protein
MSGEAQDTLKRANDRADARMTAYVGPDYRALKEGRHFAKQKAALTRAVNSGDRDKIVLACQKAVREWSEPPWNGAWPDDWSRWQRALDDALPWNGRVDLGDLA